MSDDTHELSRDAEATLIVLLLHGGEMSRDALWAEMNRLGLANMTDAEYAEWKRAMRPAIQAQCDLWKALNL